MEGPWKLVIEADAAYIFHEGALAASAVNFPPGPPDERAITHLTKLVEDANTAYPDGT